jgi:hypothetical protein
LWDASAAVSITDTFWDFVHVALVRTDVSENISPTSDLLKGEKLQKFKI